MLAWELVTVSALLIIGLLDDLDFTQWKNKRDNEN